jgi:putative component of membrane protein insertase Oxa1/YidC/SpoIIIJ protein YidD
MRFVNTLVAAAGYGCVLLLMRCTSYRASSAQRHDRWIPDPRVTHGHPRSRWIVALLTRCYRRSAVFTYVQRSGRGCRFIPSCSEYAVRAVDKHGFWSGLSMTGSRLHRCQSAYEGDYIDFP